MGKYLDIINRHGFFDNPEKCINDITRVFDTIPIIFERMDNFKDPSRGVSEETFDSLKFLANLMAFCDVMKPIVNKYNPDDETKKLMADYILNLKDDNDE